MVGAASAFSPLWAAGKAEQKEGSKSSLREHSRQLRLMEAIHGSLVLAVWAELGCCREGVQGAACLSWHQWHTSPSPLPSHSSARAEGGLVAAGPAAIIACPKLGSQGCFLGTGAFVAR